MGGLDTDSDESESDSDSDHSNDEVEEDADDVLEGADREDDVEESEEDDASDADEGDSPTDPAADVFTIGELMSSSPIVQLPDKGGHFTCVVCPGKVLRTKEFIDQHLESQVRKAVDFMLASSPSIHLSPIPDAWPAWPVTSKPTNQTQIPMRLTSSIKSTRRKSRPHRLRGLARRCVVSLSPLEPVILINAILFRPTSVNAFDRDEPRHGPGSRPRLRGRSQLAQTARMMQRKSRRRRRPVIPAQTRSQHHPRRNTSPRLAKDE